jgi:hypothetical protein
MVQNIEEAMQLPEAKELFLGSQGVTGIRTYVGTAQNESKSTHILPPPHFGENTVEILTKTLQYGPELIDQLRISGTIN